MPLQASGFNDPFLGARAAVTHHQMQAAVAPRAPTLHPPDIVILQIFSTDRTDADLHHAFVLIIKDHVSEPRLSLFDSKPMRVFFRSLHD